MNAIITHGPIRYFFCCGVSLITCIPAALGVTKAEITDAWTERENKIRSLECHVDITRTAAAEIAQLGSKFAFGPPSDHTDEPEFPTLKSSLDFQFLGEKIAYVRSGEISWDAERRLPVLRTQRYLFDGTTSSKLFPGDYMPFGEVETGTIDDGIYKAADLLPLLLGMIPQRYLDMPSMQLSKFNSEKKPAFWDGRQCDEFTLPADSDSFISLYTDARDHRVLKYAILRPDGSLRKQLKLDYSDHNEIGWVLTHYEYQLWNREGVPTLAINADIGQWSVNKPIEEGAFILKFPKGTHFKKDGRYYIQESEGTEREIPAAEYGRIPDQDDIELH